MRVPRALSRALAFRKNTPRSITRKRARNAIVGGVAALALAAAVGTGLYSKHKAKLDAAPVPIKEIAKFELMDGKPPTTREIGRVINTIRANWREYKSKGFDEFKKCLEGERDKWPVGVEEYMRYDSIIGIMGEFHDSPADKKREMEQFLRLE